MTHKKQAQAPVSAIIGSKIVVVTRKDERISGNLEQLDAYNLKLKTPDQEATVPLDSVASIELAPPDKTDERPASSPAAPGGHPNFTRDIETTLASFEAVDSALKSSADYTDYGRQVTEIERVTRRFATKYAVSEEPGEIRIAALLSAALNDYLYARTIWTLKLGRNVGSTVSASESPAVADAIQLYPDLKSPAGDPSPDKLIAGLWKHATEKVARVRILLNQKAK
ncbi:MAG TPA: hypothetical protein VJX67_17330 [Blastocatellia bacterium]|nr:hypothetical protein [Blastocatellia bacterium]